jgi:hypothetical protein
MAYFQTVKIIMTYFHLTKENKQKTSHRVVWRRTAIPWTSEEGTAGPVGTPRGSGGERRNPDGITHARGGSVIGGSVVAPRGRGGERRGPHCITRAGSSSIGGGLVGAPRGRGGERRAPHGIARACGGLVVDGSVRAPRGPNVASRGRLGLFTGLLPVDLAHWTLALPAYLARRMLPPSVPLPQSIPPGADQLEPRVHELTVLDTCQIGNRKRREHIGKKLSLDVK